MKWNPLLARAVPSWLLLASNPIAPGLAEGSRVLALLVFQKCCKSLALKACSAWELTVWAGHLVSSGTAQRPLTPLVWLGSVCETSRFPQAEPVLGRGSFSVSWWLGDPPPVSANSAKHGSHSWKRFPRENRRVVYWEQCYLLYADILISKNLNQHCANEIREKMLDVSCCTELFFFFFKFKVFEICCALTVGRAGLLTTSNT